MCISPSGISSFMMLLLAKSGKERLGGPMGGESVLCIYTVC